MRTHYVDIEEIRVTGDRTAQHKTLVPGWFRPGDSVTVVSEMPGWPCQDEWYAGVTAVDVAAGLVTFTELCEATVTLDGRPAKIGGARNEFATVTALPDGPSYEWRWAAAAFIVARDGAFKS